MKRKQLKGWALLWAVLFLALLSLATVHAEGTELEEEEILILQEDSAQLQLEASALAKTGTGEGAVFGIAVMNKQKPVELSWEGNYTSVLATGTYKNQRPSLVYAAPSSVNGLQVIEAWRVQNLKNNTQLTMTARLNTLPTLGEGESLAFYTLNNGAMSDRPVMEDVSAGDLATIQLAFKGNDGIALVRVAADPGDLPVDNNIIWANSDIYLTGKMPGNAVVDATPVTVEIGGEIVLAAYDVKIYTNAKQREKGKTWQPSDKKVQVHFFDQAFGSGQELNIYHMADGSDQPEKVATVTAEDNWITFEADSFSTYVVTTLEKIVEVGGDTYKVTVTFDSESGIPADAELTVSEMTAEDASFADYAARATQTTGANPEDVEFTHAFDISLTDPKTGEHIQPGKDVWVSVQLIGEDKLNAAAEINVVHFGDQVEKVESRLNGSAVEFATDSFSMFVVQQVRLEKIISTPDGMMYKISVEYDSNSGFPEDAEINAEEVPMTSQDYRAYLTETATALNRNVSAITYTKMFDISIVDKAGVEYQPNDDVKVTVTLLDQEAESVSDLRVVHFGAQTQELDAVTENTTVSFDTDGFSLFSFSDFTTKDEIIYASFGNQAEQPQDNILQVLNTQNTAQTLNNAQKFYEDDNILISGSMPPYGIVEALPAQVQIEDEDALLAYDIKIYANTEMKDAGINWQPSASALTVQMNSDVLEDGKRFAIYHMEDANSEPEYIGSVEALDHAITFEAESFSIYPITETKLTETIDASDGNTYEIEVTYKNTSGIPMKGTELLVSELLPGEGKYDEYLAASAAKVSTKAENIELSRVFDIKIVDENDHSTVYEPVGDVEVSIRLVGETLDDYANLDVLHFVEDENAEGFTVYDMDSIVDGETVQFTTDSFSVYVVAGYVLETTIDIEGQTYKVTVTYDDNAGLPGDAKLEVSEMDMDDPRYVTYMNDTAEALGVSAGELGYLRLLDIGIVGENGTKYAPNDQVKVTVELIDEIETGALRVVHFGAENEELTASTEGDAVTFTTDSFSLFSFADLTLIQNVVDAVFGSTYTDQIYENDDIIVSGRMPRTAIIEVNPAEVEIDGEDVLVAYDIKIYAGLITKALGIAWQPTDGALTVKMKSDSLTGRDDVSVYHIADGDSTPEKVTDAEVVNNSVEFQADSFSVYVLGGQPLRSYRFFSLNASGEYVEYQIQTDSGITTFTQIIKSASEGLVVPQLPSIPGSTTSTFSAWYVGHGVTHSGGVYTYTSLDSDPFDFDNIPEVTATEEVDLFARFADYAYVIFHDQYNGSVGAFPVAVTRRGEKTGTPLTATIQISDVTVAYDSDADENSAPSMAFYGWSYTPITTPGSHEDDQGQAVTRISTDTISVTSTTKLYPIFMSINWLNYYSGPTGSGATYIPSKYYYVGEGPEVDQLSVPVRSGYTFQGWYTGSVDDSDNVTYNTQVTDASGNLVVMNDATAGVTVTATSGGKRLTLTKNATLFAKWTEAAVNYTVVIWRQKVTDAAGLANANKTYDYAESFVLTDTTGATVSVANTYKGFAGSEDYVGFNYSRCDGSKTVAGDGSTVLNVYYDRNEHTITFRASNSTTNNSNANSPIIHTVSALYGADINDIWAFTGSNGISYPLTNRNTSWYPIGNPSSVSGRITKLSIMPDENLSFYHYITNGTQRHFYYYVEALPDDTGTRSFEGNEYTLYTELAHDFNIIIYNTDFWQLKGYTRYKIATAGGTDVTSTIQNGGLNGVSWTDSWNSTLYFYYTRNSSNIEFYDSYTHQLVYVNGTQLEPISVKYEDAIVNHVPATPTAMQIVNVNGELTPQVRPGYSFTGWYTDEACSTRVFFEDNDVYRNYTGSKVLYDKMPDNTLKVYAGWETEWYLIQIDPNYGSMNNGASDSSWFWEAYNGDPIEEYTWVTRDYVESATGTFYYVKHDRAYYGYTDEYVSGENDERHTFYTDDPSKATELTTFKYAKNAYRYAGWYEVHADGTETLYNFGEPVTHNVKLKLHWKKIGTYYVQYNPVVTQSGLPLTGTIDSGDNNEQLFLELDDDNYADNADVVVTRIAHPPEGYNFVGWRIRGDSSEKVYGPGETFKFLSRYATVIDGHETIIMDAVYTRIGTAKIIYDANGGVISSPLDYGAPTSPDAPEPTYVLDTTANTAMLSNLVNNSEVRLSKGNGFTLSGSNWSAELVGWNTKRDATGTHFELNTAYYVDTEEPITLYAEWRVKVYYHRNKADSAWGDTANWAGYTESGQDVYYTTVYLNRTVSAPTDIPVSTISDNLVFRYWGTQRYGDATVIDPYDFSKPVTGELHLYGFWAGPIELPIHVLDSSAKTIAQVDAWRRAEKINVYTGDVLNFTESSIAANYVNVPAGYNYAFTAVHKSTDSIQNVSEDEAITQVYYNVAERVLYVKYADTSKPDAPLDNTDEVYFVYYRNETLPIGYKWMNSSGTLANESVTSAAPTSTTLSPANNHTYNLQTNLTAPLTWKNGANASDLKFFAYAIGEVDTNSNPVTRDSQLHSITSASDSNNSRPPLQVRNTWRGFQYSTDNGATWVDYGYSMQLYVVYFESLPTVITLNEKTIGTAADMAKKFTYSVVVTQVTQTYTRTERQNRSYGSWGSSTWTDWTLSSSSSDEQVSSSTFMLADGEQETVSVFYVPLTETSDSNWTEVGTSFNRYRYKNYSKQIVIQTITIIQNDYSSDGLTTEITEVSDGTATQNERKWVYTTSESSTDQSVTYTNTHTPLTVEVHLGIIGANGTVTKSDDQRRPAASPYTLTLNLGNEKTFLTEIPSASLYEAAGYGFAGVYYGTDDGTTITTTGPASTVTYGQVTSPNIYELYFNGDDSQLKGTYHVYYLYYPLPKLVYVKETSGGALTRIQGSTDGTTVINDVTYNHAVQTLNGVTVKQEQLLPVSTDLFTISQSSGAFSMLPLLDDGTDALYLRYAKLGVAGTVDVNNTANLMRVTEDKLLYLQVIGSQLKWSLDNATWNSFTGTVPTVYAIYTEIGHDLEITKTVVNDGENPPKEFTVTISSNLITNSSYEVEGIGYPTIAATPATTGTPGTIVMTVKHGSIIKVKGLSRGSYTVTESGNENYTFTAMIGETAQTITNNSLTVDLSVDKKVDLTNTRKYADVTVTKTLIDPILNSGIFSFTGTLMDGTREITSRFSGLDSFSITASTSAGMNTYTGTETFNLPVGAVLTVTEDMTSAQGELYEGTVTPATGSLTVSETAEDNVLNFTNIRKSARLTITKNVTGDMGDRSSTNQFTFTLVSVADETSGTTYAWTKTAADSSTTSGTLATGSGSNTFTLAHGESIVIELPLNKAVVISENNGLYKPTWSTSDSTVTLANTSTATVTATLTNDASVTIENNLPAVAPTGLSFAYVPFLLMAAAGITLGLIGRRKRREKE